MKKSDALEAKFEAQKLAFGPIFFQVVSSLKKLGVLDFILKHRNGVAIEEICRALNLSNYGVRVLLEAASCANVVEYKDEDHVVITLVGYYLATDEMTKVNMNFTGDVCYDGAKFLTESIQEGKPIGLKTLGNWSTVYEGLAHLPEQVKKSWFEFDHFYSDNAFPAALETIFKEKPAHIFDIGGNTGKWAMTCCEYDPKVKVTLLDLPGQLNVAKKNCEAKGILDRTDFFPINLLDTTQLIPKGADVVWMSQFLDCFSESEIVNILKNVAQAADENTSVFILETFIDNQRFPAAEYCLTATSLYFTFIANGNSKMYSLAVFHKLIAEAGLKVVETHALIGDSYHTILKCKKA